MAKRSIGLLSLLFIGSKIQLSEGSGKIAGQVYDQKDKIEDIVADTLVQSEKLLPEGQMVHLWSSLVTAEQLVKVALRITAKMKNNPTIKKWGNTLNQKALKFRQELNSGENPGKDTLIKLSAFKDNSANFSGIEFETLTGLADLGMIFDTLMVQAFNQNGQKGLAREFERYLTDYQTGDHDLQSLATWGSTILNEFQTYLNRVQKETEEKVKEGTLRMNGKEMFNYFRDACNAMQVVLQDCLGLVLEGAIQKFQNNNGYTNGVRLSMGRLVTAVVNKGTGSSNSIQDQTDLHLRLEDSSNPDNQYEAENINIGNVNFRMAESGKQNEEPYYSDLANDKSELEKPAKSGKGEAAPQYEGPPAGKQYERKDPKFNGQEQLAPFNFRGCFVMIFATALGTQFV